MSPYVVAIWPNIMSGVILNSCNQSIKFCIKGTPVYEGQFCFDIKGVPYRQVLLYSGSFSVLFVARLKLPRGYNPRENGRDPGAQGQIHETG